MRNRPILRSILPVVLLLSLSHCSCQRQTAVASDPANPADARSAMTPPAVAAPAPATADATASAAEAARDAVTTLHAYLGLLPGPDRNRADAYWSGGRPGAGSGDWLLRDVADLGSMRVDSEPPRPLDQQWPPRAFEIPVRLRLATDAGPGRLRGWYRLRARTDGQGWEITSAELDPVLD